MLLSYVWRNRFQQRFENYSTSGILASVSPQNLNRHRTSFELEVDNHQLFILLNFALTNDCEHLVFPRGKGVLERVCKVELRVVVIENRLVLVMRLFFALLDLLFQYGRMTGDTSS